MNSTFTTFVSFSFIKVPNSLAPSISFPFTLSNTSPNCNPAIFAGLPSVPPLVSTSEKPTTKTPSVDNFIPTLVPPGYNFISSNFCTATYFMGINPKKSIFTLSFDNFTVLNTP